MFYQQKQWVMVFFIGLSALLFKALFTQAKHVREVAPEQFEEVEKDFYFQF